MAALQRNLLVAAFLALTATTGLVDSRVFGPALVSEVVTNRVGGSEWPTAEQLQKGVATQAAKGEPTVLQGPLHTVFGPFDVVRSNQRPSKLPATWQFDRVASHCGWPSLAEGAQLLRRLLPDRHSSSSLQGATTQRQQRRRHRRHTSDHQPRRLLQDNGSVIARCCCFSVGTGGVGGQVSRFTTADPADIAAISRQSNCNCTSTGVPTCNGSASNPALQGAPAQTKTSSNAILGPAFIGIAILVFCASLLTWICRIVAMRRATVAARAARPEKKEVPLKLEAHAPDPDRTWRPRDCPVCLDTIESGADWLDFCCGHGACGKCFRSMAQRQALVTSCPLCRKPLLRSYRAPDATMEDVSTHSNGSTITIIVNTRLPQPPGPATTPTMAGGQRARATLVLPGPIFRANGRARVIANPAGAATRRATSAPAIAAAESSSTTSSAGVDAVLSSTSTPVAVTAADAHDTAAGSAGAPGLIDQARAALEDEPASSSSTAPQSAHAAAVGDAVEVEVDPAAVINAAAESSVEGRATSLQHLVV